MFTCTNYHNKILTVQLCEAHEFEWRCHDPANNITTYKYPGMDEFCVRGFITGDTFVNGVNPIQLNQGSQWYIIEPEWDGGDFKGLSPGDIVTISSTIWDDNTPGAYVAWVMYDDRMGKQNTQPYRPTSVPLFNQDDVEAGRIRFYK